MNIKINDTVYSARVWDNRIDRDWGGRQSKEITLEMDAATAASLFVDDAKWSIVTATTEHDMSDYSIAGPIVDNRNGTVTVKMGKPTDSELLAIIMGGK